VTEGIIKEFITKAGNTPRQAPDDEILERCLLPMINEGAKILAERKAIRASDIDIIYQAGYGFPAYRGGPMFYADQMGLDKVVARMKQYAAQWGADFEPAPLLAELAASGKRFQDWRAA
jgi:3-hydroxyacyl-CoA dehydrogenase